MGTLYRYSLGSVKPLAQLNLLKETQNKARAWSATRDNTQAAFKEELQFSEKTE